MILLAVVINGVAGISAALGADTTAPTVTRFENPTSASRGNTFTTFLEFSEPVSGVDLSDFEATYTGGVIARIVEIQFNPPTSGPTLPPGQRYGVRLEHDGGDGTVGARLKTSGTGIADLSGNAFTGGGQTTGPIYISPTRVRLPSTQSATGTQNVPFSYQVVATDALNNFRLNFLSGPLPPGLALAPTGLISGTPSVAGTTTIGVHLDDPGGSAVGNVVITINPAPTTIPP
ncbi:MAG TPA: hypothetical protein VM029_03210, partial [Opitutaceae bacterium]|nr:hypothetical protein [Opitutaceae bacterium]